MDKEDKEIQELLKKFIMLSALAKDDSPPEPLPVFLTQEVKSEPVIKSQPATETRFPALRAKLAKVEQVNSEETTSSEE